MKLVKLKSKEILGADFEYAGKYMFRLYKPDENNEAIYMPIEIPEDTREYLEALLWTGINVNQEIKITEGADYILGPWSGEYKIKLVHMYEPIFVTSKLKGDLVDLDLIMYQDGAVLYLEEIPSWWVEGDDYYTTSKADTIKLYTEREDFYVLSDVLYNVLKDKDVVFEIPSRIITTATELRETKEGMDWTFDTSRAESALRSVTLLEKPVVPLSDYFKNWVLSAATNPDEDSVNLVVSSNGLYYRCTNIPSRFIKNEDYADASGETGMRIYTSSKTVYILSLLMDESLKGRDIIFRIPEHLEYNVEIDPESVVINYEGAYKLPIYYEDEYLTAQIHNIDQLYRINEALDAMGEYTVEDFQNPLQTIGHLLQAFASDDSETTRVISWLINNKFDEISQILAEVDAGVPTVKSTKCCSNGTFDLGSSCSTLEKYTAYMNQYVVSHFGNLDFLRELFCLHVEGNLVPNEELIYQVTQFCELYNSDIVSQVNPKYMFCCPQPGTRSSKTVDNFLEALKLIGTSEECSRKQFITFWSSKFIQELLEK